MKTEKVSYQAGGVTCKGYLAYEESDQPKPLVMVVPAFQGCNQFIYDYAEKVAAMGYIGFAVDMYGDGVVGTTFDECLGYAMELFNNRPLVRERMLDTYAFAKTIPQADPNNIAAIGFCLGGLCVLDLARSGADINGVASFHGTLLAPGEDFKQAPITAKMLVLTGYDDPQVPPEQVQGFCQEMKNNDFQVITYSQTRHGFMDRDIHLISSEDCAYSEKTSTRAWQACSQFFKDIFV